MTDFSKFDKKLLHDIELYGWHVIKVPEDEIGPPFGYSVGFYHSFKHPEILIIGLDLEAIHYLINRIGDAVREGAQFGPGKFYTNLIEGVDCYFTLVDEKYYKDYVNYAAWYYQEIPFPLLQCIYPTVTGIYPWQPEWPESLKNRQPVLGNIPDNDPLNKSVE